MPWKKLRAALRRRKLRAHGVARDCEVSTITCGDRSGVWTVHDAPLAAGSVVYSFGVGDNIAWDRAMIARYGVELHAFDPTPRSRAWIAGQQLPAEFRFHEYGLADFDGEMEFAPPKRPGRVNYSAHGAKNSTAVPERFPVRRLASIAAELGHARIDVLKMDIEGAEMRALPDLLASGIPVGQLLVEFHYGYANIAFDETVRLIDRLRENGYRIFHVSDRGYEFSFLGP